MWLRNKISFLKEQNVTLKPKALSSVVLPSCSRCRHSQDPPRKTLMLPGCWLPSQGMWWSHAPHPPFRWRTVGAEEGRRLLDMHCYHTVLWHVLHHVNLSQKKCGIILEFTLNILVIKVYWKSDKKHFKMKPCTVVLSCFHFYIKNIFSAISINWQPQDASSRR